MSLVKTWGERGVDDFSSCTEDAFVYGSSPNNNYDDYPYIAIGVGSSSTRINRSFLRFNLFGDIPSGATVLSGTINLYCESKVGSTQTTSLYRVLQNWDPTTVTWNIYDTGFSWNTAGCGAADDSGVDDDPSYDRHATPESTIDASLTGVWYSFNVTDLAQGWVDGSIKEYGVLVKSDNETTNRYTYFSSADSTTASQRPYLEITYVEFTGYFDGYVYEKGVPVVRTVRCYRRDDGSYVTETTSSGSGYYYLETTYSGTHYLVCLDAAGGDSYNDLIIGNITPTST